MWIRVAHEVPLVEAGHRVLATDASPAMVELARDFVPTVPVEVLRLPDDPLPTADAIVSVGHALSYLDSEEDIDRSLAAMAGALEDSGILAFDICDLEWGSARRGQPPGVWFGEDWVLTTRRSVIDDRIFRREMTMFVRDGELWRRDDETHDNVLIDTGRLPELLARFGVDAEVRHAFGDETLHERTRRGRRPPPSPLTGTTSLTCPTTPDQDAPRRARSADLYVGASRLW